MPVRTITGLGTEPRSVSFADKEPWLGVLVDSYANGQPIGQSVMIFNYITGAQVRIIRKVADTGSEAGLVFRPRATEFVTASSSGATMLWDAATGKPLGDFPGPDKDWTSSLAFSSDGRTLAAGFSKEVRVWDVASRQVLATITPDIPLVRIMSLVFTPDGKKLLFTSETGALFLWDAGTKELKVISYTRADRLAFSPDGKWLATVTFGSPAVLWNTAHWVKQVVLADTSMRGANYLAFSPDGKSLAVGSDRGILQVWDMDRLVKTRELAVKVDYFASLAFASDGHTLAAGLSNQALVVWDLREVGAVEPGAPAPAAVPDTLAYIFPRPLQPGSPLAVQKLQMFNDLAGWGFALDGPSRMSLPRNHLLHTADGGETWREAALPQGGEPGGFFALDVNTAWTAPAFHYRVENGTIMPYESLFTWRTVDGGRTWQQSQPFSLKLDSSSGGVSDFGVHMQFFDRNTGRMLVNVECTQARTCQWLLYQTTDGGGHWQRVSESGLDSNLGLVFSMVFWDGSHAWGAGSLLGYGFTSPTWKVDLPVTNDSGRTWETRPIPPPGDLPDDLKNGKSECGTNGIQFIGALPGDGPAAVNKAAAAGVSTECMIYTSEYSPRYSFYNLTPDRGKTWQGWSSNGTEDFISATTGWRLVSTGPEQMTKVLQTTDSGATWQETGSVPWFGSLDFVSDQVGWAIANQQEARALLKTVDGGKTWIEVQAVLGK